MLGDIDKVTTQCESQMERVWQNFSEVINTYLAETETNRSQYQKLKMKDAASSLELQQCYHRANNLSETIANLKVVQASSSRQCNVADLTGERDTLIAYLGDLRTKFQHLTKLDARILTELTQTSNGAIKVGIECTLSWFRIGICISIIKF